MKVSVITICYNMLPHIEETIRSMMVQDHPDIEYIVIDGGSTDGTQERVERYAECIAHFVSEPDNGVYDAMNKGLRLATGDVVAFVNAGDLIASRHTISYMAHAFEENDVDVIYGDVLMVDPQDISRVKRFWKSGPYQRVNFRKGWMPPHLGTYIRKSAYDRFGLFDPRFKIGADYELMFRFLYKHQLSAYYVPKVLARFRLGGVSNKSMMHILRANIEVYRSWGLNDEHISPWIILRKPLKKVFQLIQGRSMRRVIRIVSRTIALKG